MNGIPRTNINTFSEPHPLELQKTEGIPSQSSKIVSLAEHQVQLVDTNPVVVELYNKYQSETFNYETQKKFFSELNTGSNYSDEKAFEIAIKASEEDFLKNTGNNPDSPDKASETLKAKQLEIDLLHQHPLSNPNSHACWVNTPLETLKFCAPSFPQEIQQKVPELMKFSQGQNVDAMALRKEVRGFIGEASKNKISEDGTVLKNGDPNDILEELCQKLGLESETEKFFFNTEAIQADRSPQALMQSSIQSDAPLPERDQFIMTINRELNDDHTMKRCSCENLFTPFKILDSPESPSYQPLAITCNVGAHFVSFQKIGTNWHLRDDLNLLQNRLNQDMTLQPKPSLKQALDLHSPCHMDQGNPNKTWMQYIQETAINILFEKAP